MSEEPRDRIVVPFKTPRAEIARATAVRSTLLTASVDAVKRGGHFEQYQAVLAPEAREAIVFGVAGVWLPMEAALAHYAAIDALHFSEQEIHDNGRSVGTRLNTTFLGVVLKVAGSAGTTPWLPLANCGKVFERAFQGGGLQVERLGPKEARIEVVALPIMASAYFRGALRGQVEAGCELFCKRAYVREEPRPMPGMGAMRVSWV